MNTGNNILIETSTRFRLCKALCRMCVLYTCYLKNVRVCVCVRICMEPRPWAACQRGWCGWVGTLCLSHGWWVAAWRWPTAHCCCWTGADLTVCRREEKKGEFDITQAKTNDGVMWKITTGEERTTAVGLGWRLLTRLPGEGNRLLLRHPSVSG